MSSTLLTHLSCSRCGLQHEASRLQSVCRHCGAPLLAAYDLATARATLAPAALSKRPFTLWRYRELLPLVDDACCVTLGEGGTPLLSLPRLGQQLGLTRLLGKLEGSNPTGCFKDRGMAVAVSKALELGAPALVVPSAGNAGGALAAYAARAGLPAHVVLPADAPPANIAEAQATGARIHLVDGLIDEAGRQATALAADGQAFNLATLREPYRLEGKKTMGYELAEQLGWCLPDVIIYPTGGGTGLIGMVKAFDELEHMGWIQAGQRPRMVSVQAEGCAPIVKAFDQGHQESQPWTNASTAAAGLRVPHALGDFLILRAIRDTLGTALAVSDDEMRSAQHQLATAEGIWVGLEGAATVAAVRQLRKSGWLGGEEQVVLFLTSSGLK